jgi:hypothetical protein
MVIENALKAFSPLSQSAFNIPTVVVGGDKKNNSISYLAALIIGGIGCLLYLEWERKKRIEEQQINMCLK